MTLFVERRHLCTLRLVWVGWGLIDHQEQRPCSQHHNFICFWKSQRKIRNEKPWKWITLRYLECFCGAKYFSHRVLFLAHIKPCPPLPIFLSFLSVNRSCDGHLVSRRSLVSKCTAKPAPSSPSPAVITSIISYSYLPCISALFILQSLISRANFTN
jgi:hypothetical protein